MDVNAQISLHERMVINPDRCGEPRFLSLKNLAQKLIDELHLVFCQRAQRDNLDAFHGNSPCTHLLARGAPRNLLRKFRNIYRMPLSGMLDLAYMLE
jgi:hypothetical protein